MEVHTHTRRLLHCLTMSAPPRPCARPIPSLILERTQYIHSKGLCHADMSLENALIDARRENSYIIDFGMSVAMPSDSHGRRQELAGVVTMAEVAAAVMVGEMNMKGVGRRVDVL